MSDPLKKILEPIKELQVIRGVELPIGLEFLQLIVTGPPGAGKSYYIEQIKGWPNEGYLDLAQPGWWKDKSLIYRPREVHLGLPFKDFKESLTVFDKDLLRSGSIPQLEFNRIVLPPHKNSALQTNWMNRYIFEFLIPGPNTIYDRRKARQSEGYYPVDEKLTLEMVQQQVAVYREVALYLHRAGLNVYLRKGLDKTPMFFAEPGISSVPRWTLENPQKKPALNSLASWKYLFRRHYPIQWITVTASPQQLDQAGRIAHDGRSFCLQLGTITLRFQPEIALGVKKKSSLKNWVINTNLSCSSKKIRGFMRLKVGETIVIGRNNKTFAELFDFDKSVVQRHVSIANHRGDLLINPLTSESTTSVYLLEDLDLRERLERGRHKELLQIRRNYGQEIAALSPKAALDSIRAVNSLLAQESFRRKNSKGEVGGLLELPKKTNPVIIGDLHAKVNNLLKLLSENCLLDCLRLKTSTLIILGDAVHSEKVGEMDLFESSSLIMDIIIRLKLTFPENVFYLRGNHDSFSPDISKNGHLQGELFEQYLMETRGHEYVQEMKNFYNSLAYVACSEDFLCCHAGPPRFEVKRSDIINIEVDSKLARELTKNRIQRPNHLSGYSKSDVKKFRKNLKLAPKTPFIVGHTPMDPFGSYWLNASAIKNHHVIYSAHDDGPSMFIQTNNKFMPISYPAEPLTEFINNLS